MLTLSITNASSLLRVHRRGPNSDIVQTILGARNDPQRRIYNQTGNPWFSTPSGGDILDRTDLHSIARTSEYLLFVGCLYFQPINVSDRHSLQVLAPVWDMEKIRIATRAKGFQGSVEVNDQQELDSAIVKLPEEVPENCFEEESGRTTAKPMTWFARGKWLEPAVLVENVLFDPHVRAESVLYERTSLSIVPHTADCPIAGNSAF